ncbi:MAG TPA: hypothetical protein VI653_08925 [Steroidobacteraceae bacterium]
MNILHSFSVLAALSFAGAACAQTVSPAPNGPSTSVTHPTANPELDGASTAARDARIAAASAPAAVSNGMQVRSESGELLGSVSSIIPGDSRNDHYVVVADLQGLATMMPYSTAIQMAHKDKLVVDRTAFEKAPKVQQSQSEDDTRDRFERKADEYWKSYAMNPDSTGPVRRF